MHHPLWGGLSEGLRQTVRRVPLRQRLRARERSGAQVVARYADSIPLVVSRSAGAGRVLFVNTTMDRRWGEWPTEGRVFVPTVHMLMSAAITTEERTFRNSVSDGVAGRPLRLYAGKDFAGAEVEVESIPGTVDAEGRVAFEGLREPGVFELRTAAGEVIRPVAINVPAEERGVSRGDAGVVRRQLEGARKVASADDSVRITMARETSSWWQILLIAGLLLWILEPWLVLRTIAGQQKRGTET